MSKGLHQSGSPEGGWRSLVPNSALRALSAAEPNRETKRADDRPRHMRRAGVVSMAATVLLAATLAVVSFAAPRGATAEESGLATQLASLTQVFTGTSEQGTAGQDASEKVASDQTTDQAAPEQQPAEANPQTVPASDNTKPKAPVTAPSGDVDPTAATTAADAVTGDAQAKATALAAEGPVTVSTTTELHAAINQTPFGQDTTIILEPDANGEFNMGEESFTLNGEHITLTNPAGESVTIKRANNGNTKDKPLFTVQNNHNASELTVELTTVTPGDDGKFAYSGNNGPFIRELTSDSTKDAPTVTINGGTYSNNTGYYGTVIQNGWHPTDYKGGNAGYWDRATEGGALTITGGVFSNNAASDGGDAWGRDNNHHDCVGGGVIYIANKQATSDYHPTTITGGTFDGNSADFGQYQYYGGGLIFLAQGYLEVSGGTFTNNKAPHNDGGVIDGQNMSGVLGNSVIRIKNRSTTFDHNTAGRRGGAIAGQGPVTFYFEGGTFTNNTAYALMDSWDGMGGAIYTDADTESQFAHAVVYGNIAGHFGGGIWLCPSGHDLSTTSGNAAIFDNSLANYMDYANDGNPTPNTHTGDEAGADIAVMFPNKPQLVGDTMKYPESSIMINPSWFDHKDAATYYWDNQPAPKASGYGNQLVDVSVTNNYHRYMGDSSDVELAPGTHINDQSSDGGIAAKAVVADESYKDDAKSQADLVFTGNVASKCGGAIATDGTIVFSTGNMSTWKKVDETPQTGNSPVTGKPFKKYSLLSGSAWKVSIQGDASNPPYQSQVQDDATWEGADPQLSSTNRWSYDSDTGTWSCIVVDREGFQGYFGYDTDAAPGEFMMENLNAGTYTLQEYSAPNGYDVRDDTFTFTVPQDGKVIIPTIEGDTVDGQMITDHKSTNPRTGVHLEAAKKLDGGTLSDKQFKFRILPGPLDTTDLALKNEAEQTQTAIANGTVVMPDPTTATNNADGYLVFGEIEFRAAGSYVFQIQELDADGSPVTEGYTHDGITYDSSVQFARVTVNEGGGGSYLYAAVSYYHWGHDPETDTDGWVEYQYGGAVFTNTVEQKFGFSFTKVDNEDQSKVLAGAEFKLFLQAEGTSHDDELVDPDNPGADFTPAGTVTSGDDGAVSFDNLARGTYRLVETAAPDGYQVPKGQWKFELDPPAGPTTNPYHPTMVAIAPGNTPQPPAFVPASDAGGALPGGSSHGLLATNVKTQLLPSAGGDGGIGRTLLVIGLVLVGAAGGWVLYQHRVSGVWAWEPGGMPFGPGAGAASGAGAGAATAAGTANDVPTNPYARATHEGRGPKAALAFLLGGTMAHKSGSHAGASRFARPRFSENLGLGTPPEPPDGSHHAHGCHGK